MANIMDLCESLAQEGRLAQKYTNYKKETKDKKGKERIDKLVELSKKKMAILHELIKEGRWNLK